MGVQKLSDEERYMKHRKQKQSTKRLTYLSLLLAFGFVITSCAGSDATDTTNGDSVSTTDTQSGNDESDTTSTSSGTADGDDTGAFDEVLSAIEGLEREERENRLIELANQEEGISIYTSNSEMEALVSAFEEKYDGRLEVSPSVYRANADTVRSRLLEEDAAGFRGADLTELHSDELQVLVESGLLQEFTSPLIESKDDALDFGTWFVDRMTAVGPTWNTDKVGPDEVPTSYEDLIDERWRDDMFIEPRAFQWMLAMWTYFDAQLGWSDEEIEEYFRALVDLSIQQNGMSESAALLAAGDVSIVAYLNLAVANRQIEGGAPISHQPFVEPVVILPDGVALLRNAKNPAGAILFLEFLIGEDGQALLEEEGQLTTSQLSEGGVFADVEYIVIDPVQLIGEEGALWRDRMDRITQGLPLED
jgi:iron(III) transport system substrate-binding protein